MALSRPFKEDCLALFIVYILHSAELTAAPPLPVNWHNLLAESAAAPSLESFLSCYVTPLFFLFSSVQDCIHVLGEVHMHSTPSLRSFPQHCL